MVRVPRGVGLRTRSGPEGSSLKRSPAGAAGAPGPESRAVIGAGCPRTTTRGARSISERPSWARSVAPWLCTQLMDVRPWPALPDEDRWLADTMDRRLRESTQTAEQLRSRARELLHFSCLCANLDSGTRLPQPSSAHRQSSTKALLACLLASVARLALVAPSQVFVDPSARAAPGAVGGLGGLETAPRRRHA